jgi:glycosyltransferase involved in cell wall biosynthesis
MVTVTVVICAYTQDRWAQIVAAVRSVRVQTTPPEQVVLVIDHNDELLQRATAAFPDVTVLPNAGPRGLSGARNTGIAASRGDVVAFLDDDAEAETDWLARLLGHYVDPDVIGVGGSAVPKWDRIPPSWFPAEFLWVVGCSFTGQPSHVAPVRNMIGCNMSFRRDALRHIGGFNAALGRVGRVPVGCEETELCIRARQRHPAGVVLYDPGARVRHRVPIDRATWDYFRRRCFAEGRSKAVVARLVGVESGLSSEREYTRRALPRGVWREVRVSPTDPAGLLRAGAIVAGLTVTATGYLSGRARRVTDAGANRFPPSTVPDASSAR